MLRIGIVGPGWIAERHKRGIELSGCAELVAITGGREETLDRQAATWGVPAASSLSELVRDHDIDAAWVLSPTPVHYEQLEYLLSAGIPSLVEKPPTLTLSEAVKIGERLLSSGIAIMPGHNRVYEPAVREMKSIIETGEIGTVVAANLTAVGLPPAELMGGWRKSLRNPGGGAFADSGYHLVYLSLYLFGEPMYVFGSQATVTWDLQSEDTATAILGYENGLSLTLLQSWATKDQAKTPDVIVWGTRGTIALYGEQLQVNGTDRVVHHEIDPFAEMVKSFDAMVRDDKQPVQTFTDAVMSMAICGAYYRSCDTGGREVVEDISGVDRAKDAR